MREIPVSRITDVVERLCIEANTHLPGDVKCAIETCRSCEDGDIAVGVLDNIIENYHIADRENLPGGRLLANINPSYTWVKLAQRVPVRIGIDPGYAAKNRLRAGTTATVTVLENTRQQAR